MSRGYAYDHAWTQERVRLAGLESALDPGTHAHLLRLGVGPGRRCLEIGAGGGAIALWLAEHVLPNGKVVATDLETDFLEQQAARSPALEVLRHDITVEDLPTGFDLVHARWLVEWLPDKRQALRRMLAALRPGGVLLDEEPDFVTIYEAAEPPRAPARHARGDGPSGTNVPGRLRIRSPSPRRRLRSRLRRRCGRRSLLRRARRHATSGRLPSPDARQARARAPG